MSPFAFGMFMWNAEERRSRRYGFVYVDVTNYDKDVTVDAECDQQVLESFEGKHVKITCQILEARNSGHFGDHFLNPVVTPTTPKLNERITLGVGTLQLESNGYSDNPASEMAFGLKPSDQREMFWLDPLVLYKLHDQTVRLYIEETDEPDSLLTIVENVESDEAIATGDGFQCPSVKEKVTILSNFTNLGDDTFMVETAGNDSPVGTRFKIRK